MYAIDTVIQAVRTLFVIEGAKIFKKWQFQDRLKQPNLEKSNLFIYI